MVVHSLDNITFFTGLGLPLNEGGTYAGTGLSEIGTKILHNVYAEEYIYKKTIITWQITLPANCFETVVVGVAGTTGLLISGGECCGAGTHDTWSISFKY